MVVSRDAGGGAREGSSDRVLAGDPDFYEVLGVTRTATLSDIKKSFRVKVKAAHPDKGGDAAQYNLLLKAHEVLSSTKLREHYDSTGRTEKSAEEEFLESFGHRGASGTKSKPSDAIDFAQRMVRPQDQSHTSGFEEWMRTRDMAKTTIDDEYIRNTLGVSKASYETVPHPCKHATTRLVRKPLSLKASQHATMEDFVQAGEQRLRKTLEWGEVLVNIMYAPVNPYDLTILRVGEDLLWSYHQSDEGNLLTRAGREGGRETSPATEEEGGGAQSLGSEGVAKIVAVGPGVKEAKEGDWVMPLSDHLGTWQTAGIWRERELLRMPPDLMPVEYAAVARELFLAYHLLQDLGCELQAGDAFVLNAANSLVGQTIIQLAKLLGLRAIAVIRRHSESQFEKTADYLTELGANRVYGEDEPIRARLLRDHAALPKVAYDAVLGPLSTSKLVHTLQEGGKLIVYGGLSGQALTLPWHLIVSRDVKLRSFYLAKWLEKASNQQTMVNALENISKLLEGKKLLVSTKEIPMKDYRLAFAELRSMGRLTKPLLKAPTLQEEALAYATRMEAEKEQKEMARALEQNLFTGKKSTPTSSPVPLQKIPASIMERGLNTGASLKPMDSHQTTLIFLHDREELPEEYEAPFKRIIERDDSLRTLKVVLPEAPLLSKGEDGEDLPCWCSTSLASILSDPSSPSISLEEGDLSVLAQLEPICQLVAALVEREAEAVRARRVVVAGFSEGAVVALFTALAVLEVPIGAVVCFGLPRLPRRILRFLGDRCVSSSIRKTRVFVLNGSHDDRCPATGSDAMKKAMGEEGFSMVVSEAVPNGKHEVGDEELAHFASVMGLITA